MELASLVKRLAVAPFVVSFGWITLTKLMDRLAEMFDLCRQAGAGGDV